MAIVCLDSQILIWGIKEEATKGQEDMIPRAQSFLKWLDENDKKVIIPAPIITEILMPVPRENYEKLLSVLHAKFRVVPFDEIAAIKCAEIWHSKADDELLKEYRKTFKIGKPQMRYAFQIAAIALTRQVECIYSHDPHLKTFAGNLVSVRQIPPLSTQLSLF
ncbi:MAG: PIN domain-containing protein [Spirosomaceae bacterium]|nr:PIN domain-containing protein [Spirosomataceae bacterium]